MFLDALPEYVIYRIPTGSEKSCKVTNNEERKIGP